MPRQLVIELVGKADKFTKTLGDAETASKSFGDKIEGAGKKMSLFASVPIAGFLAAGTKAAVEDAAAQEHLANTLANTVGNSKALVAQTEDFISKLMKASTFTDDELRPAFETFALTTKSVEESQKLLGIAMDVAAGKNIDLETATKAVAKANEGQLAAANKLVPGLVDVKDETLGAKDAVALLAQTFDGQAKAATETTAGKMQNLKRDLGEASEAMGSKLMPAVAAFAGFATDTLLPTLDKLSGGNGAFVLLGVALAGPVLSNVAKVKTAIDALNLTLDSTAVKASAALGALGIVVSGTNIMVQNAKKAGGSTWNKATHFLLGNSDVSDFIGGLFAAGGRPPLGKASIVGERGPELFVPDTSGTIIPNGAWGMGGATPAAGDVTVRIPLYLDGRVVTEVVHNGLLAKQRRTPLRIGT